MKTAAELVQCLEQFVLSDGVGDILCKQAAIWGDQTEDVLAIPQIWGYQ
jgi:hypothetical protein